MEEEKEVNFVVSPPAFEADGRETVHIEGSEVKECWTCGGMVWLSPSSRPKIAEGYELICYRCLVEEHGEALKEAEFNIEPEQAEELIEHFAGGLGLKK